MTIDELAEIAALFNAVYGEEFPPARLQAWFLVLKPLPSDQAKAAAVQVCRTSSYPPKPADIVRLVEGDPRDVEQLLEEEAEAALVWFEDHLADYETVDYGPVLNSVVRALGGPDTISTLMANGEWKFHRDEFRTLYKTFRRRGEGAEPPVPANVAENMQLGFEPPAPRLALFAPPAIPRLPAVPPRPVLPVGTPVRDSLLEPVGSR